MGERYWPFPVKPEATWSDRDRDIISFMRQAYAEGFRPREGAVSAIEAEAPSGRSITLVFRGAGHGWEPFMSDGIEAVRLGPLYELCSTHASASGRLFVRARISPSSGFAATIWRR